MPAYFFTIGYEGTRIEDFIEVLKREKIKTVIDIRELPLSRKKGFSKQSFSGNLKKSGIDYIHLKSLGDPREGRLAAREGRFSVFKQIFLRHLGSDDAQQALFESIKILKKSRSCFVCFEKDHSKCHRHFVAESIVKRSELNVRHLSVSSRVLIKSKSMARAENDLNKQWHRTI